MKFFTIKGKRYIAKEIKHSNGNDEFVLTPLDLKKYREIVQEISKNLSKAIKSDKMLEQVLANMEWQQVLKIRRLLKKGIKPKAKKGCYQIQVGSEIVDVVG